MQKPIKTGKAGIAMIKEFEGFRSKPYLDAVGIPTIGYGATHYADGRKVKLTDKPITEAEASALLQDMLKQYEKAVLDNVTSKINQNQFDALISFVTYYLPQPFPTLPVVNLVAALGLVITEYKSVREKADQKLRRRTDESFHQILKIAKNREDLLEKLYTELAKEKNKEQNQEGL